MKPNSYISYRTYQFSEEWHTIIYNHQSKQYCFLESLSSQLFDTLVNAEDAIQAFIENHEISEAELNDYIEQLIFLGIFGEVSDNSDSVSDKVDNEDNSGVIIDFSQKLYENGLFYAFHLDVTNRCNLHCIHCYHPFEEYIFKDELSYEQITRLIDDIYDLGVFNITLSGGEIFVRKDIFEILEYISNKRMLITLFTNAMRINEEIAEKLQKYNILKIGISLYSDVPEIHNQITQQEDSYSRTLNAINLLLAYGFLVEIKCVAMEENKDTLMSTRAFAESMNCSCILDFGLCGKVNGDCSTYQHRMQDDDLKAFFFQYPELCCGIESNYPEIPTDGSPCNAGKYSLYRFLSLREYAKVLTKDN